MTICFTTKIFSVILSIKKWSYILDSFPKNLMHQWVFLFVIHLQKISYDTVQIFLLPMIYVQPILSYTSDV